MRERQEIEEITVDAVKRPIIDDNVDINHPDITVENGQRYITHDDGKRYLLTDVEGGVRMQQVPNPMPTGTNTPEDGGILYQHEVTDALNAKYRESRPHYIDADGKVHYGIGPQTPDELLHATFPNLTQGSNDDGSGGIEKVLGTTTAVNTSGDTISTAERISNFEEGASLGSGQPPSGSTKTVTQTTVSGTGTYTSQYVNGVFVGGNRTPHGSNDVVDTKTNFEQPATIPSYSDLHGPAPSKIRFRAYNNYISAQFAYDANRSAKIEQMNQSRNQGQQETGGNGG
jgi:hypothetical protein